MLLVTGGAGFIGSNFVLSSIERTGEPIVNLDKLTYAGNLKSLAPLKDDPRHTFVRGDICDRALVRQLLETHCSRGSRSSRPRSSTAISPGRAPSSAGSSMHISASMRARP